MMRNTVWPVWALRALAGVALLPSVASLVRLPLTGELIVAGSLLAVAYLAGYFRGRPVGAWVYFAFGLLPVACGIARLWDRLHPPPPPLEGLDLYGGGMADGFLMAGVILGAILAITAGFMATAVFDPPFTPSTCGTARTGR